MLNGVHAGVDKTSNRNRQNLQDTLNSLSPWKVSPFSVTKATRGLGMFRLLVPMVKWKKSTQAEDEFDNIRIILSKSKVEAGWNSFVQEHGNLFYIGGEEVADHRSSSQASGKHEMNDNHFKSKRSNPPIQTYLGHDFKQSRFSRLYEQNSEETPVPNGNSQRQNVRFSRNVQPDPERRTKNLSWDYSVHSDDSDTVRSGYSDLNRSNYSKYLDSGTETASNVTTPLHFSQDSYTGASNQGLGKPGKRKSFYLTPNFFDVEDLHSCSGVVLCEKLFGVILYQYNQRPPRPNGSNIEQLLRERKVIVQGVVPKSEAEMCGQIYRGDMLVGLNDIDVTWVNIDDIFKLVANQKVKLTFQVPLVIGPKLPTPPHTPTHSTPPLPPHNPNHSSSPLPTHLPNHSAHHTPPRNAPPLPPHLPTSAGAVVAPPPRPPPPPPPIQRRKQQEQNLVAIATGESISGIANSLRRYPCSVMYLTFAGETENAKEDVVYQFPADDNKLVEIRGLYMTLSSVMEDVTHNSPKITTVTYRGGSVHTAYWKHKQDVLLVCLPADRVPSFYILHILSDVLRIIKVLYGSVCRVFEDSAYHSQVTQLVALTLHRVLMRGVTTLTIQPASPLEPLFLDMLSGVRWLRLTHDSKILCDEILSEFEAADFAELEEDVKDERRQYGILGSCLFFKDYLLCSHLFPDDLCDVHLFLKYHSILSLVNKQPLEELVIWREFYPTRLCHISQPENPGFSEPRGRWFLLVTGLKHFLMCTLLEAGGYASQASGNPGPDPFYVDQAKATLIQLETEDVDLEECCQERLLTEWTGPRLQPVDTDRQLRRASSSDTTVSPVKSPVHPSPRHRLEDDTDRSSLHAQSHAGSDVSAPVMTRQGSKMSYGSNDSNGSSTSLNIAARGRQISKAGSVFDIVSLNRSFSENNKPQPNIKWLRGQGNQLYHYVCFDCLEGLFISPSPYEIASVQGSLHHHILYNFYASAVRIHNSFQRKQCLTEQAYSIWKGGNPVVPVIEEGVMFSCQTAMQSDQKKPTSVLSYWVVGRMFPENKEMFVCFQDGTCQTAVETAFSFCFGLL